MIRSTRLFALANALIALSLALPGQAQEAETFEFSTYQEVLELFEGLDYTPETWAAGLREVNRVYLQEIPPRWRSKVSREVEVRTKKQLFLRAMAPLVLRSNELILEERDRLLARIEVNELDDPWLQETALKYRVIDSPDQPITATSLDELRNRIDVIPPSLALAQTIEESGWGTSRFAEQGNALFGQWSWSDDAIKPENQRDGKGNYGIARFDSPQDSVNGYMLNINRHFAYEELRAKRAAIRAEGREPAGADLVTTLTSYSERGQAYVDGLQGLMSYNRLHDVDEAVLVGPVILMVPVGAGAE